MHVDLAVLTIQQCQLTYAHRQRRILQPEKEGHQHREGQGKGQEGLAGRGEREREVDEWDFVCLEGSRQADGARKRGAGLGSSPYCTHIV